MTLLQVRLGVSLLLAVLTLAFVTGGLVRAKGPQTPSPETTSVWRVIDGDTLVVDEGEHVRVLGLDCPELKTVQGQAAAERAGELLPRDSKVTLEFAPEHNSGSILDRYGRTLAYVRMANGRDFGLVMVQEGFCRDFRRYPHPRTAEYRRAER